MRGYAYPGAYEEAPLGEHVTRCRAKGVWARPSA